MRGKMSAAGETELPSHLDAPPTPLEDIPELPAQEDRHAVTRWRNRHLHCVGGVTVATMLDLIRQHTPAAFDYLMLHDVVASGLAIQRHWLENKNRTQPSQEETDAVRATVEAHAAAHGKAATKPQTSAAPLPPPTLRQLVALRETYRRDKIGGWERRVAALNAQIAEMEEKPWAPAGL